MADPYQKCTCGCGRSLKHCASKTVIHELDAIEQAIAGNQRIAAQARIDSLLAAEPQSTLLLALKARVQLELGEIDAAKETVAKFEQAAPDSPTMKVLRALTLAESDSDAALHSLLSAWGSREDADPQTLAFSIVVVAQSLMAAGNPAAAIRLLEALRGEDEVVARLRSQATAMEQREIVFLRMARVCDAAPAQHPLKQQLDAIDQAIYHLDWLKADQLLQEVAPKNPRDPEVLRRIGSLLLLRQQDDAWAAWKHLSNLETEDENERLFAEIVSVLTQPTDDEWMANVWKVTYPVESLDEVMEKIVSDGNFFLSPQPPEARDDGPPPRAEYFVLDREPPANPVDCRLEDVPRVIATLVIFGKQTDAPARLVLIAVEPRLEMAKQKLDQLVAGLTETERESQGEVPLHEVQAREQLFITPEYSTEDQERLRHEMARHTLLEQWPQVAHPALGGQSMAEAVKDDSKRRTVNALVVILEGTTDVAAEDARELRSQLGLAHELVSPESVPADKMIPFDELTRLPLSDLSDEQLMNAASQLAMYGSLLGPALDIALQRPSLLKHDKYQLHMLCEMAAKQASNRSETVQWLLKAADAADARGDSAAEYLLELLVPAAMTQNRDLLNDAMNRLTTKHIDEPGVRENLAAFFQMLGIDPATGQPMGGAAGPAAAPAPPPGQADSGLWTPDGGAPASGGKKEGGGLWLPD